MPTAPAIEQYTSPEDRFVAAFQRMDGRTLNGSNANVQRLRREAIEAFRMLGIPGRKSEAWKYTNIERVLRHEYRVQPPAAPGILSRADVEPFLIAGLDECVIVLVNGRFDEALSCVGELPQGVVVSSFARAAEAHAEIVNRHLGRYADYRKDAFAALNTAFTQDGLFVYVPKGAAMERPVHVLNLSCGTEDILVQPRNLIVVEEGGSAKLIESEHALAGGKSLTNTVTEVYVGRGADVQYFKLQDHGSDASEVDNTFIYQEEASTATLFTVTLSGEVVRNNVSILPDAEHCESNLFGLFLGHGKMHVDNHTLVDHAKPNCNSNELYKGILDDESTGVFNGKVFVRPDAQKTNAYQSNKSIVLTPAAKMYSKPELEIYADDVRCSHGATTGQIDREAMFYLKSRGIPEGQARAMLLLAFARDVLDKVTIEPLRELLDEAVHTRFTGDSHP